MPRTPDLLTRGRAARTAHVTCGAVAALLLLAAGSATAQSATAGAPDARWQPWYGCWAPTNGPLDAVQLLQTPEVGTTTCVSPAGGSAVEILTVAGGKVTGRNRLVADGGARPVARDGCQGTERATWSADARRVYLHSEQSCANNVRRSGDGVLAFAGAGEWLDVRSAKIGGFDYVGVRSVRYRPAAAPAGLPPDVAATIAAQEGAAASARLAAIAPVGTEAVVDATRSAGASVTGAWLAELRQRFPLDARQLVALANAGVPGSVTDVMIATSNPKVFALGPSGADRAAADALPERGRRIGPVAMTSPIGGWGGWGWNGWDLDPYGYAYARRGYYGYGYGNSYGYGGGYYPGGWWGSGPVVVVRPAPSGEPSGIVRGRGYTQGDATTMGGARGSGGASPAADGGRASASSGASSSGASSGGASSAPASGSLGTAKPRP